MSSEKNTLSIGTLVVSKEKNADGTDRIHYKSLGTKTAVENYLKDNAGARIGLFSEPKHFVLKPLTVTGKNAPNKEVEEGLLQAIGSSHKDAVFVKEVKSVEDVERHSEKNFAEKVVRVRAPKVRSDELTLERLQNVVVSYHINAFLQSKHAKTALDNKIAIGGKIATKEMLEEKFFIQG